MGAEERLERMLAEALADADVPQQKAAWITARVMVEINEEVSR